MAALKAMAKMWNAVVEGWLDGEAAYSGELEVDCAWSPSTAPAAPAPQSATPYRRYVTDYCPTWRCDVIDDPQPPSAAAWAEKVISTWLDIVRADPIVDLVDQIAGGAGE